MFLLGIKNGDGGYGRELYDKQLLKGFSEKQREIIYEILQLLLELNEETPKYEL